MTLRYERLVQMLTTALPSVYQTDRTVFGTDDFQDLARGVLAVAGQAQGSTA